MSKENSESKKSSWNYKIAEIFKISIEELEDKVEERSEKAEQ